MGRHHRHHPSLLIPILSSLILSLFPYSLQAAVYTPVYNPVKNLVVFGDSYSDLGNFHRWTNGPVWSENVAVAWNASLHSFAYTGSACDNALFPNVSAAERMPSVRDQIELFYQLDLDLDFTETVFAVWVGINDIQKSYQQSMGMEEDQPDFSHVAVCIGQQLRNIRQVFQGSRIMVFNVPPLEHMPFFSAKDDPLMNREKWGAAARELNKMIKKDVANLNNYHHASLHIELVDIHTLLKDIFTEPLIFGFKDAAHAYLDACQTGCVNTINDYLWWDRTHMTGGAHRAIANTILMSGSHMKPMALDSSVARVEAILEVPGSAQRSPTYFPPPNTGLIDQLVEEMGHRKSPSSFTSDDATYRSMSCNNMIVGGALLALGATILALLKKRLSCCKSKYHNGLLDPNSAEAIARAQYFYQPAMMVETK